MASLRCSRKSLSSKTSSTSKSPTCWSRRCRRSSTTRAVWAGVRSCHRLLAHSPMTSMRRSPSTWPSREKDPLQQSPQRRTPRRLQRRASRWDLRQCRRWVRGLGPGSSWASAQSAAASISTWEANPPHATRTQRPREVRTQRNSRSRRCRRRRRSCQLRSSLARRTVRMARASLHLAVARGARCMTRSSASSASRRACSRAVMCSSRG